MFNPLRKLLSFLGIAGVSGRDIQFDQNWGHGHSGSGKQFTTTPMHMRKAARRRKNKLARAARRLNRS